MIRINLLPYRAERRQNEIVEHIVVALSVIGATVLICLGTHLFFQAQLSSLQDREKTLQAEIKILNDKLKEIADIDEKRKDVKAKLKLVERLQQGRFYSLKTMLALSRAIPNNVWLTNVEDKNGQLRFLGYGESNEAVAQFLRQLDRSDYFNNVRLLIISRSKFGDIPVRLFNITLSRAVPKPKAQAKSGQGTSS